MNDTKIMKFPHCGYYERNCFDNESLLATKYCQFDIMVANFLTKCTDPGKKNLIFFYGFKSPTKSYLMKH